jgi:hypothetical protein
MVIKTVTKSPWGEKQQHTATTWYEPFDKMDEIQRAVNFALSYDVTGLCTAGDTHIMPLVLKACHRFTRLTDSERNNIMKAGQQYKPLFV